MKVTIALILSNGFPVPAAFLRGVMLLEQALCTGELNQYMACPSCAAAPMVPPKAGSPDWRCSACSEPNPRCITNMRVLFNQDFPIDWARNHCCQMFLDNDNGDYLLFLDTDMVHPVDLAHQLVARQKDVVSAHYVMRRPPFFTVAMLKTGEGPEAYQSVDKVLPVVEGLIPVDAGGAGALLISRRALQQVRANVGDDWFRYQDGPAGLRSRSEDMWFYEQCKAVGIQPYLDADLKCQHIAQFEVDYRTQEPYRAVYEKIRTGQAGELVEAGKA